MTDPAEEGMSVDRSLEKHWEGARRDQDKLSTALATGGGVASPPGGPHDPGMEALEERVSKVESRLDSIDDRLRGVETGVAVIGSKLDGIADLISATQTATQAQMGALQGQLNALTGKIPGGWQMLAIFLSLIGTAVLLVNGLPALQRWVSGFST